MRVPLKLGVLCDFIDLELKAAIDSGERFSEDDYEVVYKVLGSRGGGIRWELTSIILGCETEVSQDVGDSHGSRA